MHGYIAYCPLVVTTVQSQMLCTVIAATVNRGVDLMSITWETAEINVAHHRQWHRDIDAWAWVMTLVSDLSFGQNHQNV